METITQMVSETFTTCLFMHWQTPAGFLLLPYAILNFAVVLKFYFDKTVRKCRNSNAKKKIEVSIWFYFHHVIHVFGCICVAEHDDRAGDHNKNLDVIVRKDNNRRVSFKTSGGRANNIKHRAAEMGIRARLDDDDDVMEVPRARRRGSPIPKSARGKLRFLVETASGWFHVTVSSTLTNSLADNGMCFINICVCLYLHWIPDSIRPEIR